MKVLQQNTFIEISSSVFRFRGEFFHLVEDQGADWSREGDRSLLRFVTMTTDLFRAMLFFCVLIRCVL
jgi:hypothetical protein